MGLKKSESEQALSNSQAAVVRAVTRPFVKLLLKFGIQFNSFQSIAKELYVEVAREDYGINNRKTNITRVAILTGLSRSTVAPIIKSLECSNNIDSTQSSELSTAPRFLAIWHTDPDYLDTHGSPVILNFFGEKPSVLSLLKDTKGDIPVSTLIKELVNTGAIEKLDGEKYRALMRNYFPSKLSAEAIERSGSVAEDILCTLNHNLTHKETSTPTLYEARAHNHYLKKEDIPKFDEFLRSRGQGFLEEVDVWLSEHEDTSQENTEPVRLGVGLYSIKD